MTSIHINTAKAYDCVIGDNLLYNVGELSLQALHEPCSAVIVTDDNVNALYADILSNALAKSGFTVFKFVFSHGENSKSFSVLCELLEYMVDCKMTRSDAVFALGGGVTGDMAGMAAAVYMRGIRFVQLPTTLLAMVDSSVGGKTAVNLQGGKNLAGIVYQPSMVICDLKTLSSLSEDFFSDGTAEIIKYGMIADADLFVRLQDKNWRIDIESIVARCVKIKSRIVADDEMDNGVRQLLNFGHTVGHAIEACSNYTITHGRAVGMGMLIISRAAASVLGCGEDCVRELTRVISCNSLAVDCPYTADELLNFALSDKKRSGGSVNLVLPERIGSCFLHKINADDMLFWLNSGLDSGV